MPGSAGLPNTWLYLATVIIWGTTWFAIRFQLGEVSAEISVFYRYTIATLLLLVFCWIRGLPLRFSKTAHRFMFLQGLFLFCLNYILFYYATYHLTSGLVSVMFSSVVLMNVLNGRLFVGQSIRPVVVVGGILGLLGLTCIFIPELSNMERSDAVMKSIYLCLLATFCASLGNVLTLKNKQNDVPVIPATMWGMFYGTVMTLLYVLVKGVPFTFETSPGYIISLLYLAIFGSVVAFVCYLTLIEKIGADKASYAGVMFPVVALIFSTVFEDYRWTLLAAFGFLLVMCGNLLVLKSK